MSDDFLDIAALRDEEEGLFARRERPVASPRAGYRRRFR